MFLSLSLSGWYLVKWSYAMPQRKKWVTFHLMTTTLWSWKQAQNISKGMQCFDFNFDVYCYNLCAQAVVNTVRFISVSEYFLCLLKQIVYVSFSDHLLSIIYLCLSVCLSICKLFTFSTNLQILWANLNQTWHHESLGKVLSKLFKWGPRFPSKGI